MKKITLSYHPYTLQFKFLAGTSRGVLREKTTYFLCIQDELGVKGYGEAGPLKGLSIDDLPDFETIIADICQNIPLNYFLKTKGEEELNTFLNTHISEKYPSIKFAFETAILDYWNGGKQQIFDNDFFHQKNGIVINGLIWMGNKAFMKKQIDAKLAQGFSCIKMKIGAIDFETECDLLAYIRSHFPKEKLTLRVDANGAFSPKEAMQKLNRLATFDLHSIEQPIKQGQLKEMNQLCKNTPLPIALDEELIGVFGKENKYALLREIQPQYIILKPTLLGGFYETKEWIELAEELTIPWWITSALEANIGLNAVTQFTNEYNELMPQGLGTGQLYENNIASPLVIEGEQIFYKPTVEAWDLDIIK